jgi:hypothetical protein
MGQFFLAVYDLPEAPLDAAAHFYAEQVPVARKILKNEWSQMSDLPDDIVGSMEERDFDELVFLFPPAGNEHRGWRLAAIQALAREAAPKRVNGVVGDDLNGTDKVRDWLANAPGITGQLLAV